MPYTKAPITIPGTAPAINTRAADPSHLRQNTRIAVTSITINSGNIRPTACPGVRISAKNGVAAKAAADPNPPFDRPAKITAGTAKRKKCRSNVMRGTQTAKGDFSRNYRAVIANARENLNALPQRSLA